MINARRPAIRFTSVKKRSLIKIEYGTNISVPVDTATRNGREMSSELLLLSVLAICGSQEPLRIIPPATTKSTDNVAKSDKYEIT